MTLSCYNFKKHGLFPTTNILTSIVQRADLCQDFKSTVLETIKIKSLITRKLFGLPNKEL